MTNFFQKILDRRYVLTSNLILLGVIALTSNNLPLTQITFVWKLHFRILGTPELVFGPQNSIWNQNPFQFILVYLVPKQPIIFRLIKYIRKCYCLPNQVCGVFSFQVYTTKQKAIIFCKLNFITYFQNISGSSRRNIQTGAYLMKRE